MFRRPARTTPRCRTRRLVSTPVKSTRPCVGRMPNRPQKLAGTRTEPPVSVPSAKSHTPPATTEAEPEDDPPGTRSGAAGFTGVPVKGFSPSMPRETSSVAVLPMMEAPERSNRSTIQAWRAGTGWERSQSGLPPPVGTPATSIRSFTAKVRPASGPVSAPATWQRGPGTNAFKVSSVMSCLQNGTFPRGGSWNRVGPVLAVIVQSRRIVRSGRSCRRCSPIPPWIICWKVRA